MEFIFIFNIKKKKNCFGNGRSSQLEKKNSRKVPKKSLFPKKSCPKKSVKGVFENLQMWFISLVWRTFQKEKLEKSQN